MTRRARIEWGRRLFALAFVCLLSVGGTAAAMAGQRADAMIFGLATDASGAVLPGVTVTATSPALQVQQVVAVTDEHGEYRITPLPVGTYNVEYVLAGFQTLRRESIRLTAGFVAKIDVSLSVGAVEESVTVSGVSPVVDVKSTSAGTQVQREVLESIPTYRNSFTSLLTLAAGARPQIDIGGSQLTSDTKFVAFGRAGDSWVTLDGLPMSPPDNSGNPGFQTAFNYGAIEEGVVQTVGTDAQAPTSGIQLSVISKSGGNNFHGTGFGAKTWHWMQTGSNVNDTLRAQSITEGASFNYRWDANGDVGGRVVPDKLWFWVGARDRKESQNIIGAFMPDGSPSYFSNNQRFFSSKITAQITKSQQFIAAVHVRSNVRFDGPATRLIAPEGQRDSDQRTWPQAQGTWQVVRGNKVLSVQGGVHAVYKPFSNQYTNIAAWRDDVSGIQGGIERRVGWRFDMRRTSAQATLNWYKPDWSGNHDFKAGSLLTIAGRNDPTHDIGLPMGNYELRYKNATGFNLDQRGTPSEIRVGNNPVRPESYAAYLGLYFQDSWALSRRLTLNLGVRYANDRGVLPAQCRDAAPREFSGVWPAQCFARNELKTWNPLMPRLHAAYDVTGDGKTVVKGGWGRFYMMHDGIELNLANPNSDRTARFAWKDSNGNGYYDAGESNLDLNGPDFLGYAAGTNQVAYTIEAPGGGTSSVSPLGIVPNPDLKEQGSDEFMASLERELIANFGLRITGVYVHEFNVQRVLNPLRPFDAYNIPITNPDPGPDNKVGTADDPGTNITYYDYPASLKGAAFDSTEFINDPKIDANYKSFEVAVNKRLSNHWQGLVSYSATKKNIPLYRYTSVDPNSEYLAFDNSSDWLFRASGSYQFPLDVQLSSSLMVQSGIAWGRTVSLTGGKQITTNVAWAEPIGTRRTDTQTFMNLSVTKAFRLRSAQRVTAGLQFINLLNANFDNQLPQTRSGSTFGYALGIVPPRIWEFNVRYSF